jgi:hypothetical protein
MSNSGSSFSLFCSYSLPMSAGEGGGRLKGLGHEIFDFWFFHESVSPKPLSIPLGPFRISSKIRGDICSSRFATGVVDTSGKCKKSSIKKVLII